jgi:hypothetical protein
LQEFSAVEKLSAKLTNPNGSSCLLKYYSAVCRDSECCLYHEPVLMYHSSEFRTLGELIRQNSLSYV